MKTNLAKTLSVLAFVAACGAAFAQAGPPIGGPAPDPSGRPERGPGHPPQPPLGGPRWLLRDDVRKELRLTAVQVEAIRNLAPHPGGPLLPPPPEKSGQPGDVRPRAAGAPPAPGPDPMESSLRDVLDAEQFSRFRQLRLRHEGARAILRPDVAKELGLTEAQIAGLRPAPPKEGEAPSAPGRGERPDPAREDARILSGLSETQRARWREMLGRPFDFGDEREEPPMPEGPQP